MAAPSTDDTNLNPFSGLIWANNPNVNQQLRQRIALQMMQSKGKGYPKNIGEGLTALGDALGDIGMARRLEQGDLAQQAAAQRDAASLQSDGDQSTPYAPPEDKAPAVTAIDRAITPVDTAATPQQPLVAPLTPAEVKAGVSPGDYNVLDAQTNLNFKPTPGYLQDAIAAKEKDPEMQAYYGQLSAKEAKNARDVSPTGAAGPYQITRGTGRDLGLTPAQRFDPAASTAVVQQLTAQNAATFEKINGRPPTFQELALMHQQGGVTGARMVAGTGNAPPGNLAVNNIPRGASPAQAVSRINNYYGMPNAVAPVGRDAIAAQLVAQPQGQPQPPPQAPPVLPGGPLPNPTLAGAIPPRPATLVPPPSPSPQGPGSLPDQRLALAGTALPPAPSQLRTAPSPQQLAQNAQPQPTPGYVMPEPREPGAPRTVPLSPLGRRALAILNANPNNEYYAKGAIGQTYANEVAQQKLQQSQVDEVYKKAYDSHLAMRMERQKQLADQAKRIADFERTRQETATGALIDPSEKPYTLGPDGVARPLKVEGGGAPNPTLTEVQSKNLDYYQRGRRALADLGSGDELQNFMKWHAAGAPLIGNATVDSKFQEQLNAAKEFAATVLRRESGAAVTPNELADVMQRYIPRPGDKPDLITQKEYMRNGVVNSLRTTLGKGTVLADQFDQGFPAERARLAADKRQNVINAEMEGVPKVEGAVKTNRKTGAKRMWDGTRWTEVS